MDSGLVLSSCSSFIYMQIPIQFNSYLFLNGPTGRITAMCRQMKRCWSLCYGHSANSSYVHSSGILPFNFLFCQWINIKAAVIYVQRKHRMKRPLKKCSTNCEISGSERFHTPNSAKLHFVSGAYFFFLNFHFIVHINSVLRKQWYVIPMMSVMYLQHCAWQFDWDDN